METCLSILYVDNAHPIICLFVYNILYYNVSIDCDSGYSCAHIRASERANIVTEPLLFSNFAVHLLQL